MDIKNLNIVLLCAGKSSRLKFNLPKVILPINGKTLIERSLYNLNKLNPKKIIIVTGFKSSLVTNLVNSLEYKNVKFVLQKNQLGTGHAVKAAIGSLDKKSTVLILNGDTPFVDIQTIKKSLSFFYRNKSSLTIATSFPKNPKGYGRILRDNDNQILDIVEERDCTNEQKLINEVNAGLYLVDSTQLTNHIKKIKKK